MVPIVEAGESPEHRRLVRALIDYLNSFLIKLSAYAHGHFVT
jgi:hypothetical protein